MKCEHCGSETVPDNDGYCLTCAHPARNIPPRPVLPQGISYGRKIEASHLYYETNRVAILADVAQLGKQKACKLWNIASSTMTFLLNRWNDKEKQVIYDQIQTKKEEDLVTAVESPALVPETPLSTLIDQKLEPLMKKLEGIDAAIGELLSWGSTLDEEMKADIIFCFVAQHSNTIDNAKKLLKLVEALTYY